MVTITSRVWLKTHEAHREPCRPETLWDCVLKQMRSVSKVFEDRRREKLAVAKYYANKASKSSLDPATRAEKKQKEAEKRLRKVALNISKDVKKFWTKIEKLVLHKHQLELEERRKKALDKRLDFLLGQTERYSTMVAENLVDMPHPCKQLCSDSAMEQMNGQDKEEEEDASDMESPQCEHASDRLDVDGDYDIESEDELDDDEHTIEEDEALITADERKEELEALQDGLEGSSIKGDCRLEHTQSEGNLIKCKKAAGIENNNSVEGDTHTGISYVASHQCEVSDGSISVLGNSKPEVDSDHTKHQVNGCNELDKQPSASYVDEQGDEDYILAEEEEKDDETTLLEEEELAKAEGDTYLNEIELLQRESEMSVEELMARYKKDSNFDEDAGDNFGYASTSSEDFPDPAEGEDTVHQLQTSPMDDYVEQNEPCELQPLSLPDANLVEVETEMNMDQGKESEDRIADAAAAARSAQPTGNTFLTTKVRTTFPFLLKHPLREYQHIGLDWLVTMYEKRLNGILADEMGLGKTIMTISLLAYLACEKGIWGPHLIVVPTSVMLNWETEFLKWCPAFKILTYFGSAKERKLKRQGWMKSNFFHVCITTYRLVIQDSKAFKRKKWKYLILDEAHLIKNWKSQRWQILLNFNSKRRILLTGTPLQNDLMELWSLMHFLMPHIFQSHQEFKAWFSKPISGMVEGQDKVNKEVIDRLHSILRPFLLRRLKRDVEKQLPGKFEHVIYCTLSRRQRSLYEDFIASSETQATLASANFFGMISVIMQLRKVCNHPDLFEGRPIVSSFDMSGIDMQMSYSICTMGSSGPFASVDLSGLGFVFTHLDLSMFSWESDELKAISIPSNLIKERADLDKIVELQLQRNDNRKRTHGSGIFEEIQKSLWKERIRETKERAASIAWWNSLQCRKKPIFGKNLKDVATVLHPVYDIHRQKSNPCCYMNYSSKLADIILSPVERFQRITKLVECFMFVIPAARAPSPVYWCSKSESPVFFHRSYNTKCTEALAPLLSPIRPAIVRRQVYFPDRRLIQFDCGKLQELAVLLRRLKSEGHRALIFTQMTKMLDILEAFINLYGYTYMRLDGSTQPEQRQTLMQRFNTNPKIFLFILSTRSGGVGINLVGADTVIFYDSDWNPAMDQQAQDRCHRIGQTRQVHIYRLISESTIEENILKKANQKRSLDDLVIQSGSYNTEFFKKLDPMELFSGHTKIPTKSVQREKSHDPGDAHPSNADVEAALKQAEDEADYMALKKVEQEEVVDNQEFTDEAIVRLEDDEFGYEDTKLEENSGDQSGLITVPDKDVSTRLNPTDQSCGRALTFSGKDEDFDMLTDMKQLAADAANAGQASSSFECQLRPIDRYAMRFLELWDPIIDKSAIESQVILEEKEWELDRFKKFKEEAEAEIDGDEEPLVYERWDAEFASVAYKQQVEALAQSQLPKDMECEAMEAAEAAYVYCEPSRKEIDFKPKSKNKTKKKKFRSLKKGALASQPEAAHDEPSLEFISIDYDDVNSDMFECSDYVTSPSPFQRKRKKAQGTLEDDKKINKKFSKKKKKDHSQSSQFILDFNLDKLHGEGKVSKGSDNMVMDLDHKLISRNKMGGKISISVMPAKRILVIKPEKLNKKGSIWLRGCSASPDLWSSQEDVILCAIVHEYGTNWSLVSDMLYGMTAGGSYRGRFHHPVNCCERFRELFQRYVLSMTENPTNEKFGNTGPGKAIFRATEDSIRTLLDVASDLPDNELLLQKHLTAVISSVWRSRSRVGCWQGMTASFSNHAFRKIMPGKQWNFNFAGLRESSKLVGAALHDANTKQQDAIFPPSQMIEAVAEVEKLDVTLAFHTGDEYSEIPLPSSINLTICRSDQSSSADESNGGGPLLDPLSNTAEKRFRVAPNTCFDGKSSGWASSAFSSGDFVQIRSALKQQYLGKNNTPLSDSIRSAESNELLEEQHPIYNITFSSPEPLAATDPVVSFDSFVVTDDAHSIGHDEYPTYYRTNESLMPDANIFEAVPHHYDPDIISGLDDCTNLPDFTDIG